MNHVDVDTLLARIRDRAEREDIPQPTPEVARRIAEVMLLGGNNEAGR